MKMMNVGLLASGLAACICVSCGCSGDFNGKRDALSPDDFARRCRSLYIGMCNAVCEREASELPHIYPTMKPTDHWGDISGRIFETSSEYFEVLFDCEYYGKNNWKPYVGENFIVDNDPGHAAKLKGRDMPLVPKGTGKLFRTDDLIAVAFKDFDQQWDGTPLFISSNVNPANLKLPMAFSDRSVIPIGSKAGRDGYSWKDDFVVIVRKGGAVDVIAADKFTVSRFCGGEDIPAGSIKFLDIK